MLKQNFLTGNYVYFAEERLNRPHSTGLLDPAPKTENAEEEKASCPFCPENAHMTPPVIFDCGDIKIVPNLYPFISEKEGLGFHDVVIDTKDHFENLWDFTPKHMEELFQVLIMRMNMLECEDHIKYVQIFKNNGRDAGASQRHSHWQMCALNIVPPKISYMMKACWSFYKKEGKTYFDSKDAYITVWENDLFKLAVPTDSMFTYETHLIAKTKKASLLDYTFDELDRLAEAFLKQLSLYKALDPNQSYNVCLYSAPKNAHSDIFFRFHIQIIPRKGNMAGFEFSSGCYINSLLPHQFAKMINEIFSKNK